MAGTAPEVAVSPPNSQPNPLTTSAPRPTFLPFHLPHLDGQIGRLPESWSDPGCTWLGWMLGPGHFPLDPLIPQLFCARIAPAIPYTQHSWPYLCLRALNCLRGINHGLQLPNTHSHTHASQLSLSPPPVAPLVLHQILVTWALGPCQLQSTWTLIPSAGLLGPASFTLGSLALSSLVLAPLAGGQDSLPLQFGFGLWNPRGSRPLWILPWPQPLVAGTASQAPHVRPPPLL